MKFLKTVWIGVFLMVAAASCSTERAEQEALKALEKEMQQLSQQAPPQLPPPPPANTPPPAGGASDPTNFATFVPYENTQYGFSAMLPGQPVYEEQEIPTLIGPIKAHKFGAGEGITQYMLVVSDYPPELMKLSDAKTLLEGARDGAVGNTGGKLLEDKEITVDGHPGRQFKLEIPPGLKLSGRIVMAESRLYQVMAIGLGDSLPQTTVDQYFASFKIGKQGAAPAAAPKPDNPKPPAANKPPAQNKPPAPIIPTPTNQVNRKRK